MRRCLLFTRWYQSLLTLPVCLQVPNGSWPRLHGPNSAGLGRGVACITENVPIPGELRRGGSDGDAGRCSTQPAGPHHSGDSARRTPEENIAEYPDLTYSICCQYVRRFLSLNLLSVSSFTFFGT